MRTRPTPMLVRLAIARLLPALLVVGCNVNIGNDRSSNSKGGDKSSEKESNSSSSNSESGNVHQDGADVATDVTGSYLTFPLPVEKAGGSINIGRRDKMPDAEIVKLQDTISFNPASISGENEKFAKYMGLFYHVRRDGVIRRGFIERSKLQIGKDTVTFSLVGQGNYQVGFAGMPTDAALGSKEVVTGEGDPILLAEPMLLLAADPGWASVEIDYLHTCAVKDGKVYCWGANDYGELGGGSSPGAVDTPQLVNTTYTDPFVKVRTGFHFSCGLRVSGTIWCWGKNNIGQIGSGKSAMVNAYAPEQISSSQKFKDLDTGTNHACGLTTYGKIYCWGQGMWGQIGNDTLSNFNIPVATNEAVLGSSGKFTKIAVGGMRSCAVIDDTKVACWGDVQTSSAPYRYSRPTLVDSNFAPTVTVTNPVDVTVSRQGMCFKESGGAIKCYDGAETRSNSCIVNAKFDTVMLLTNNYWMYINSVTNELMELEMVSIFTCGAYPITSGLNAKSFFAIDRGPDAKQCAVDANNQLFCWGQSQSTLDQRVLGLGSVPNNVATPAAVQPPVGMGI